jgi:hypothetical protein
MRFLGCCAALLIPSAALATTLPRLEVTELFAKADVVAIVQVVAGRTLGVGQESCGAIYTGQIERRFKGAAGVDTIEFGHFEGYEIGRRYLVFLTRPGETFDPLASTNSVSLEAEAKFRERCDSQHTAHRIMHSGECAIPILWAEALEYKDALLVHDRHVAFPDSVPRTKANAGERHELWDSIWIEESAAIRYLESLK